MLGFFRMTLKAKGGGGAFQAAEKKPRKSRLYVIRLTYLTGSCLGGGKKNPRKKKSIIHASVGTPSVAYTGGVLQQKKENNQTNLSYFQFCSANQETSRTKGGGGQDFSWAPGSRFFLVRVLLCRNLSIREQWSIAKCTRYTQESWRLLGNEKGWGGGGNLRKKTASKQLTRVIGFILENVQLRAVSQGMLEAELKEASLAARHPFQQGEQSNSLLAFVPAFEPPRQDSNLVSKHHGWCLGVREIVILEGWGGNVCISAGWGERCNQKAKQKRKSFLLPSPPIFRSNFATWWRMLHKRRVAEIRSLANSPSVLFASRPKRRWLLVNFSKKMTTCRSTENRGNACRVCAYI